MPRYGSAKMCPELDCIGVKSSLGPRVWMLARLIRLMEEHNVNLVLGLLDLALENEISFSFASKATFILAIGKVS